MKRRLFAAVMGYLCFVGAFFTAHWGWYWLAALDVAGGVGWMISGDREPQR